MSDLDPHTGDDSTIGGDVVVARGGEGLTYRLTYTG